MSVHSPSTRVVVLLDGSEFSTGAIRAAAVVARAARTGITLVGVAVDDDEAPAVSRCPGQGLSLGRSWRAW